MVCKEDNRKFQVCGDLTIETELLLFFFFKFLIAHSPFRFVIHLIILEFVRVFFFFF